MPSRHTTVCPVSGNWFIGLLRSIGRAISDTGARAGSSSSFMLRVNSARATCGWLRMTAWSRGLRLAMVAPRLPPAPAPART